MLGDGAIGLDSLKFLDSSPVSWLIWQSRSKAREHHMVTVMVAEAQRPLDTLAVESLAFGSSQKP